MTDEKPRPKPAPPKTHIPPKVEAAPAPAPKEKPKFVRKPHLTDRPLVGHDGLEKLKKSMEYGKPKRKPRPKPNQSHTRKNQEKK